LRITGVRRQSNNPRLVWVYADGEKWARVTAEDAAELGLRRGLEVAENLQSEVMRRSALLGAKTVAVRLLARRGRSRAELRRSLKTKGYEEETIQAVLEQMEGAGYVNDAEHARSYAEQLAGQGRSGPRAIYARLRARGIAPELASAASREAMAEEDEEAAALAQGRKRLRALEGLDVYTRRRRLYAFLARRGFGPSVIGGVVATLIPTDE
jgi:regulatory protein